MVVYESDCQKLLKAWSDIRMIITKETIYEECDPGFQKAFPKYAS